MLLVVVEMLVTPRMRAETRRMFGPSLSPCSGLRTAVCASPIQKDTVYCNLSTDLSVYLWRRTVLFGMQIHMISDFAPFE